MTTRSGTWRFRPQLWSTVLALLAIAVFVSAGVWQLDRAAQRAERFRMMQEGLRAPPVQLQLPTDSVGALAWRRAAVRGRFDPAATVFIDNRIQDGKAGYHVISALRPDGPGRHVLINRGWISAGQDRAKLPAVPTPTGPVTIEGIITEPPPRRFELGTVDAGAPIWPNLVLERFKAGRGLSVEPIVLLQTSATDDSLVRRWQPPASGEEKNRTYALQWFSFAAVTLAFYVILSLKRTAG